MTANQREQTFRSTRSHIVSTAEPYRGAAPPVWVKRADVHYTQEGDVVFAPSEGVLGESLRGLAERRIPRAVIQAHVECDLIKFYVIGSGGGAYGGPQWFRWLYHKDQTVAGHPFDP